MEPQWEPSDVWAARWFELKHDLWVDVFLTDDTNLLHELEAEIAILELAANVVWTRLVH